MVIMKVPVPDLIPPEMGVVIYQLRVLLVCGGTGLSNQLARNWPVSNSIVTLDILHHNLWLRLWVLSLLQRCSAWSLTCSRRRSGLTGACAYHRPAQKIPINTDSQNSHVKPYLCKGPNSIRPKMQVQEK
jgi:hypothetical protein